nr:hypothetical protein [Tanacetum cinerariifolium]GEZ48160.1 hypothetical protein [Tanacetum cinerariifolium]
MAGPITKEYISTTSKSFVSNDINGKMIKKNFIEIEGTFLLKVHDNAFYENDEEDVFNHINNFLKEYEQFAEDLSIAERIELISDLVKYQDNYAKVLKYQSQQRKPRSKKQKKEYYMSIEDFVPMGSKEEAEKVKWKGLRLEQESVKKLKTSEEVPEEMRSSEEVPEESLKEMMQLVPVKEVYVEALQVKHPIINWKIHTEGQRTYWKLWALVKESLSIRPSTNDKKKELWVELKRLYEPDVKDQLWTHTQTMMHAPVE